MGKFTKVKPHLSEKEIMLKIKETAGFWRVQRWLVILNATVAPRSAKEIAIHTGLSEQTVHNLVSQYNRFGPEAVETPGKGGRRRAYLSVEEEAELLKPFIQSAASGRLATVTEIKKALEDRLGHGVHKTTVYRLLKRHGWRKIVPRPYHEKMKKQEQDAFKKTSRET